MRFICSLSGSLIINFKYHTISAIMGSLYLSASPPHHFSTDRHCFFSLLALNLSIWWIAAKSHVDTANVFMALIAMVEVNYFNAFICSW